MIDQSAMFKLSYGLFIVSARQDDKDNACVVNTVMQVTDTPKRIEIAVNKQNLTHDMIKATGKLTVSILSTEAAFDVFQRFGFQSGRTADKFTGFADVSRAENGLFYLTKGADALISAQVVQSLDVGTHTIFIADVTEAKTLSAAPPMTYQYYFDFVKPKPQPAKKKGWVCKICGYVYEGETLPPDFICPICKHGAEDFEPLA